jgi:hypothetical protein
MKTEMEMLQNQTNSMREQVESNYDQYEMKSIKETESIFERMDEEQQDLIDQLNNLRHITRIN